MSMRPRHRRLLVGLGTIGALAATASSFAHLGVLDIRWPRYLKSDVVRRRPARDRPPPHRFQEPYSERTMLDIAAREYLKGYRGRDLISDEPLDRFEIGFLLGRFLLATNARMGKVFALRRSLDHQQLLVPVRADQQGSRWGLFELEAAMAERLIIPLAERDWWQKPMERYWLAAILGRLLALMDEPFTLLRMHYVYPPGGYVDFPTPGFPPFELSRRAIEYGLLEGERLDGTGGMAFRGRGPVKGRTMAVVLQRMGRITDGYAW